MPMAYREVIFPWPLFGLLPKAYAEIDHMYHVYIFSSRICKYAGICKYAAYNSNFSDLRPYMLVSFLWRGNSLSRKWFPISFSSSFSRQCTLICALILRLFQVVYYSSCAVRDQRGPSEQCSTYCLAAF